MKLRNVCAMLSVLMMSVGVANAVDNATYYTVYKTVGAKGETKYAQMKPETGEYEEIQFRQDGRINTPGEMAPAPLDTGDAAVQNRMAELQQQVNELKAREDAQRCAALRTNLANLNSNSRVYVNDDQGGRRFLTDQEIVERRTSIQEKIAQFCQ